MVSGLNKVPMTFVLLAFAILFFALAPTCAVATTYTVEATASSPAAVQVDQVSHTIKIQKGALVIINETLELSPKGPETFVLLQNFSLGFPYKINDKEMIDALDYCFAYDASKPEELFRVERDTGLGRLGFYGVNVVFPESGVNIDSGESYNLTVIFVFSGLVSSETASLFELVFPMYPSLGQNASVCNVTVILPPNADFRDSTFHEKELDFNITAIGDSQILKHSKMSLESFEYEPAWLSFNMTALAFPIIEFNEVKREIALDQWGSIHMVDSYSITNRGYDIRRVEVGLPEGAYDLATRDEMGSIGNLMGEETVTLNTRATLSTDGAEKFFLIYLLPWEKYVSHNSELKYDLNFSFFERFNWTIRRLDISITIPKGAEFETLSVNELIDDLILLELDFAYGIARSVFQETVTFTFFNVTPFNDLNFDLEYRYSVFWASFYPTLWVGALIIIASAIAFLWRAPKPPAVPIVPVPPGDLRSFVEAYEGKTRILSELESMEEQLRKGKIPRRRYKVRKKMLEGRLSTLSRDLSSLGEKIRIAGPKYANMMRQIEVAETMLEGVGADIRRVEARYRQREISKGAYGKLIEEYRRRMERARTTIDGVLLRLREEIR